MGLFGFGAKKEMKPIRAFHYEGIDALYTDCPCWIRMTDSDFEVKSDKPEINVNLPKDRIKSVSCLDEDKFMQKYHGNAAKTSKLTRKYLAIEYTSSAGENKMLAMWILHMSGDTLKLIKMQNDFRPTQTDITL